MGNGTRMVGHCRGLCTQPWVIYLLRHDRFLASDSSAVPQLGTSITKPVA
jgi:hypothetical protein